MERDVLLKKNIIGGFDKKQVMAYISRLQESCDDRKTRGEIDELRSRIEALREILREKDKEIAMLTHQIDEVSTVEFPDPNASGYDILKRSAAQVDEAREKADEITGMLSENIKAKGDNISALFNKLTSINQSLSKLSGNLSGLSDRMESVPFDPVTEQDVDAPETPEFDFEKVADAIQREEEKLSELAAKANEAPKKSEPAEETAEISNEPEEVSDTGDVLPDDVEETEETTKKRRTVTVNEDKLNILFARLVEMTEEINRVHSSISDVSEKIDRIPEEKAAAQSKTGEEKHAPAAEPVQTEETVQAEEASQVPEKAPVTEETSAAENSDVQKKMTDKPSEETAEEITEEAENSDNQEKSQEETAEDIYEEQVEEKPAGNSPAADYVISISTENDSEEAPAPASIEVTSITDKTEKSEEIPVKADSDEEIDDIFDNFELDTPTEDSVIQSAIEKFKAEALSKLPGKKKPAEEKKAEKPAPAQETEKKSESESKTETPADSNKKPEDGGNGNGNGSGNGSGSGSNGKKPDDGDGDGKPPIDEEVYFTLNF